MAPGVGSGRLSAPSYNTATYDSSKYAKSSTAGGIPTGTSSNYQVNPVNGTTNLPSSQQFSYNTGNPYASKLSSMPSIGTGPLTATRHPRPPRTDGGRGRGRGRGMDRGGGMGRGGGRGGSIGPRAPKPQIIKPKPPPALTSVEKQKIENHNMKQLVAPKPPHR